MNLGEDAIKRKYRPVGVSAFQQYGTFHSELIFVKTALVILLTQHRYVWKRIHKGVYI